VDGPRRAVDEIRRLPPAHNHANAGMLVWRAPELIAGQLSPLLKQITIKEADRCNSHPAGTTWR
jgi:hypothetical protein